MLIRSRVNSACLTRGHYALNHNVFPRQWCELLFDPLCDASFSFSTPLLSFDYSYLGYSSAPLAVVVVDFLSEFGKPLM